MNLLDAFKQYIRDAMPGGALSPEWTPDRVRTAGGLLDFVPVLSNVKAAVDAKDAVESGEYAEAALLAPGIMLGGATKASGFGNIRGMLTDLYQTHEQTGKVKKLPMVPAVKLTDEEKAAFNSARTGLQPKLTSPVLQYRGNHHFQSRGPTEVGNDYPLQELMDELESLTSQDLVLRTDRRGPALLAPKPRTNYAGQKVNDKMVINVDSSGRGELYSVITVGDGLRQGEKAPATPGKRGDRSKK